MKTSLMIGLAAGACLAGTGAVAQAEAGTDPPPVRADLSANFPTQLRLSPVMVGAVSSRLPGTYTATPTISIGGAPGTSDLKPLLRLRAVSGHAAPTAAVLRVRTTLSERRRIRSAERRLHRRAVLLVKLTGTFDDGTAATSHLREFVIRRG